MSLRGRRVCLEGALESGFGNGRKIAPSWTWTGHKRVIVAICSGTETLRLEVVARDRGFEEFMLQEVEMKLVVVCLHHQLGARATRMASSKH